MKPTAEGLTAALNLTPEQQTKVKAWLEAKAGQAVLNPAELAAFLTSIAEGDQKVILRQWIGSETVPRP